MILERDLAIFGHFRLSSAIFDHFLPFSVIFSFYGHFSAICGHFQASFKCSIHCVLIERREPLNIDHLTREKLVAKVGALQTQVVSYEQERFDFEMVAVSQKYQINQQRVRISMLQAKSGMGKSSTSRPKIVSMTNNKAKTVFK